CSDDGTEPPTDDRTPLEDIVGLYTFTGPVTAQTGGITTEILEISIDLRLDGTFTFRARVRTAPDGQPLLEVEEEFEGTFTFDGLSTLVFDFPGERPDATAEFFGRAFALPTPYGVTVTLRRV
ncbi:MAG: hypothetical protein D6692_03690, partial [Planctomycetota bacterium]